MLIKRMLLVALIATVTTKLMCSVDSGVMRSLHQYGVQSNRISDTDFNSLINQAKLVDDWNSQDLAVSSIVRAQFTDAGDTTLAGINRAPVGVNPADLKALIAPETSKSDRQVIADRIIAAPSTGSGSSATLASKLSSLGITLDGEGFKAAVVNDAISADELAQAIQAGLLNVSAIGNNNQNALHYAAAFGNTDKLSALLQASNPSDLATALSAVDVNGRTPKDFVAVHSGEGRASMADAVNAAFAANGF